MNQRINYSDVVMSILLLGMCGGCGYVAVWYDGSDSVVAHAICVLMCGITASLLTSYVWLRWAYHIETYRRWKGSDTHRVRRHDFIVASIWAGTSMGLLLTIIGILIFVEVTIIAAVAS